MTRRGMHCADPEMGPRWVRRPEHDDEIDGRDGRRGAMPDGAKDELFFDETVPGFGIRVTSAGARVFIIQYNVGKAKRRTAVGAWDKELTTT
jgi:hypothetical protein